MVPLVFFFNRQLVSRAVTGDLASYGLCSNLCSLWAADRETRYDVKSGFPPTSIRYYRLSKEACCCFSIFILMQWLIRIDLEVPGLNPSQAGYLLSWLCIGYTVLQTVQRLGVHSAAYGTVHYIEPFASFEIRVGLSPGFWLSSVTIFNCHNCGESDVKLYSQNSLIPPNTGNLANVDFMLAHHLRGWPNAG